MVGCVGGRMRSHIAHQLLVGTLVIQLDQEPAVRSVAAEALLGACRGGQHGCSVGPPGQMLSWPEPPSVHVA